ncbi:hypothetical protein ACJX0J_040520 [Zea mays]
MDVLTTRDQLGLYDIKDAVFFKHDRAHLIEPKISMTKIIIIITEYTRRIIQKIINSYKHLLTDCSMFTNTNKIYIRRCCWIQKYMMPKITVHILEYILADNPAGDKNRSRTQNYPCLCFLSLSYFALEILNSLQNLWFYLNTLTQGLGFESATCKYILYVASLWKIRYLEYSQNYSMDKSGITYDMLYIDIMKTYQLVSD